MAFFCIPQDKAREFRKALKDKSIDIAKLIKMESDERTKLLEKYVGENAKQVNTLFEEKLVLKNKLQGIKNWASKVGGIGRYDPNKKAEIDKLLSEYRQKQQERIFNPKENESFLSDLAEETLGTRISKEEAKNLWDLSVKSSDLLKNFDTKTETWKSPEDAAKYGASKVTYLKYVDNLKTGGLSVKGMLKEWSGEIKSLWKEDKPKAVAKIITDSTKTLTDTLINAVASWDNSFLGRQGGLTLIKSPKTWWNTAKESFSDIYKTFKGEDPQDVLLADVYSDPDYINGNYEKAKISFGIEEEVPIKVLENAPVIGKIFKASDVAFIDSAIRARRGLFKIMKEQYQKSGIELDDANLKDIGTIVNAITARGRVGQIGTSAPVRLLMWAPRMLKADWDILTAHTFGIGLETKAARIEAAKNVARVVVVTAAIAAIAKAMGAQVEEDPRSTDFLRIKIGDTRINAPFVRGMPQLVTLFSRISTKSKKTASGIITKLNDGKFVGSTIFDVGIDFLANKTTPPVSAVIAWMKGKNFAGEKTTVANTASNFIPISVQNFIGLKDNFTTQAAVGAFIDLFGFSANTYSSAEVDWSESDTKELQQFKDKIGEQSFKTANKKFNKSYSTWLNEIIGKDEYKNLSEDQKRELISNKKKAIKKDIFREYGFRPKRERKERLPNL